MLKIGKVSKEITYIIVIFASMNRLIHLLDGLQFPCQNEGELSLDFSFDNFSPNPTFLSDFFPEFHKMNNGEDAYSFLLAWIRDNGIQSKVPYTVVDEFTGINMFNGSINPSTSSSKYNPLTGVCKVKAQTSVDDFRELAKQLNLRSLYDDDGILESATITRATFGKLRTVKEDPNDLLSAAVLSLSVIILIKETFEFIRNLQLMFADIAAGGLTGALAIAFHVLIAAAYAATVILAIIPIIKEILDSVLREPRSYAFILWRVLMVKAFRQVGYEFETSIFDGDYANIAYIASTSELGKISRQETSNNPIPDKTLLDFLEQDVMALFNLKLKVVEKDRKVILEPKTFFWDNPSNYVVPDLKNNGFFSYNSDELYRSVKVRFDDDPYDLNIFINKAEAIYEISSGLYENSITKELEVGLNFVSGKRKNELTRAEEIGRRISNTFNKIMGRLAFSRDQYISYMRLGSETIQKPRVFISNGADGLAANSEQLLRADTILTTFYAIESPLLNQFKIYTDRDSTPICNDELLSQIIENNVARDTNGDKVLIERNERNLDTNLYELTYRKFVTAEDIGYISPTEVKTKVIYG